MRERERASNQLCCISSLSYRERQLAVTSSDIAAVHLLLQSPKITTATTTTLTTPAVLLSLASPLRAFTLGKSARPN